MITEKFCNRSSLDTLKALIDADIKIVQLREKEKSKKEIFHLAEQYRKLTRDHNILLIINDHLDIGVRIDADGVHLGQDDFPYTQARQLSKKIIIGVSTHNLEEIKEAQMNNASYINVGPIFPTQTKEAPMQVVGLKNLKNWLSSITIPFTVMGGIKEENISQLKHLGIQRFAMVTEITMADNIKEKIKALRAIC